jgi:hypothetical protein
LPFHFHWVLLPAARILLVSVDFLIGMVAANDAAARIRQVVSFRVVAFCMIAYCIDRRQPPECCWCYTFNLLVIALIGASRLEPAGVIKLLMGVASAGVIAFCMIVYCIDWQSKGCVKARVVRMHACAGR